MAYNVLTGNGVKQVIKGNSTFDGNTPGGGSGSNSVPYYKDITVTSISDITKATISVESPYGLGGSELQDSTTLRVYYTGTPGTLIVYYQILELY